jgi:broad specificity phosphatase PhoE
MRLYLVRHGQTAHNAAGLALGRANVPLNETGIAQAAAAGRALATYEISAIYSSPLQRARDTAAAVAEPHDLPVMIDDSLIEMDVGELDGLQFAAVGERYPDFIKEWLGPNCASAVMPGGESLTQVRDRASAAIKRLQSEHESEGIVVVTHNFVILTLLAGFLGLDLARFRSLRHDVGAISRVEWSRDRPVMTALNDTCHLLE